MEGQEQKPKLLAEVRRKMRLHHYSIHTERSYIDWIKRYVGFHSSNRARAVPPTSLRAHHGEWQ